MRLFSRRTLCAAALFTLTISQLTLSAADRRKTQNAKSPSAESTGKVGSATVRVDYNSPSLRSRDMATLVPSGKVWRTGADAATQLTTSGDIMIGDLKVPAGTYSLYTVPGPQQWMLVVNKQTGQWGTEYSEGQDLGRVPMTVTKASQMTEQLKIDVSSGNKLMLSWGDVVATAPMKAAM